MPGEARSRRLRQPLTASPPRSESSSSSLAWCSSAMDLTIDRPSPAPDAGFHILQGFERHSAPALFDVVEFGKTAPRPRREFPVSCASSITFCRRHRARRRTVCARTRARPEFVPGPASTARDWARSHHAKSARSGETFQFFDQLERYFDALIGRLLAKFVTARARQAYAGFGAKRGQHGF